MTAQIPLYFNIAVAVLAICAVLVTVIMYWVAKNLISGSASLKKLVETLDYNVQATVDKLQSSINDINEITDQVSTQMGKLEVIMDDVQHAAGDARSLMHMMDETVVPAFTNVRSVTAGLRKAIETWNEMDEQRPEVKGSGGERKPESAGDGNEKI